MTERECIERLLPLAEGFVQVMHRDPSRDAAREDAALERGGL